MAFNLFDFSNVVGSKLNPLVNTLNKPQASPTNIGGATGGGMMPPTSTAKPLPQASKVSPAPSFMERAINTLVPKASANEGNIDMEKYSSFIKDAKARGKSKEETKEKVDDLMARGFFDKATYVEAPIMETPTKTEEPGFLRKTFEGLKSAPEAAFEGLTGLATGAVKGMIGEEKFKKEGEKGNLGYAIGKQESALTNLLKTSKGVAGSAFTAAAPGVATTIAGVGATEYGGKALGTISDVIHFAGQSALNQIPALKEMTEQQKNDFTDTLVNAFGVRSATKGVGGKSGVVKKLNTNPGTTLKELGSGLINLFYETEAGTARAMQRYNAGLSPTKPITIGDVAGKYNIAGGTKQMGADAIVAKTKLWEKEIAPKIDNTRIVTNGESLMSNVLRDINQIVEPTQKAAMLKAFKQINEQYKGKQFSAKELADLKSTLQAKTVNVSETSAARSQILDMLSKEGRKTLIENVKKETGKDITNPMFEYGALRTLEEMGQKAAEGAEHLKITGRASAGGATLGIVDALTSVITPVKNVVGGFLYSLGNGIEFIGPKGINSITDILKNSDKVKIKNPQVLMNKLQMPEPKPLIKAQPKQIPSKPGSLINK